MNFYSPIFFLFSLGLIPIILMYLLKKQHKDIEISSNFLWKKTLRDIEANKPWQKLRKNLLLLLQILAFIFIVLTLTQPYIISDILSGGSLIIVLDSSASMQSTDVDYENRFNKAKADIRQAINNLKPQTEVTLISMDKSPGIIVSNSINKSLLKRKLDSIKVSDNSENLKDTVSLVKAITKDMENYQVLFYTDKNIEHSISNMIVKNINGKGDNLAIENLSYTYVDDNITVLTRIKNYSQNHYNSDIILYTDDEIHDVKEINLAPDESKNIYWYDVPYADILKAEIDLEDSLTLDNYRYAVVNKQKENKVLLVSKGNVFLQKAIDIQQSIELYRANEADEGISGFDLYVYDGLLPKELPKDGNLLMLNPPSNSLVNINSLSRSGELKVREDELFANISLDFTIRETKVFDTPPWGLPVLLSDNKPIILKGEVKNQKIVAVGFDINDTDLPLKIDFPIFIQNVLSYTLNLNNHKSISVLAGENIKIDPLPKSQEVYITNSQGIKSLLAPPFPLAPYTDTNSIGIYTMEEKYEGGSSKIYFAVNVNTSKESNTFYDIPEDNEELSKEQNRVTSGRNMKNIFIWLALAALAIEWVVYNRGY